MVRRLYAGIAMLAVVTASGSRVGAEIEGDTFFSKEWGVGIRAPGSWQMTEQTSYPNIILHLLRPYPPGRILLSAECVPAAELKTSDYAKRTSDILTKVGFRVRAPQLHASTGAYWIDFDNGKAFLRQALLVSGRAAYALTLSAPDSPTRSQHLRAFDYALRSIEIEDASRCAPAGAPETASD